MATRREQKEKRRRKRVARRRQEKQGGVAAQAIELSHHAVQGQPESRYLRFTLADLWARGYPSEFIEGLRNFRKIPAEGAPGGISGAVVTEHYVTVDVSSAEYRALVRKFQPARRRMYGMSPLPGDRP